MNDIYGPDKPDHLPVAGSGKYGVTASDGEVVAPEKSIPNAAAAKVVYDRLKHNHVRRCWTYEKIQGMIDGNPPYNPKSLARAGLSDMCNVNWKDGDSIYRSVALAYWSLFNDVEQIAEFRVNLSEETGLSAEWGNILSEEWDRVIRSWPNFSKHMSFHQGELLKFGLNALIWPDERDWRFKPVNARKFLVPDQTQNDIEELTTVVIEHHYTAQFLWDVYNNLDDNESGHWNKEALAEILWQLANISDRSEYSSATEGCEDIQSRIRNGDAYYDALYNDDIILVSIFQKEYDDEKISHMMIHHDILTEDFVYMFDRQYENFQHALIYFTFQPGQETIHGNKGLGHAIFSSVEAITQLDCSVLDQARRAGMLLLRGSPTRGGDERSIRFVHGGVVDIGEAELAQNTMGNNVAQTVEVSRYFKQKISANNNISGMDPAFADRNVQSVRQLQMQATKEAKVQKNMIAHYYEQLDHLFSEIVRKMLLSKKGYPGYEYAQLWKDRCIARGIPAEVFDVKGKDLAPNGLPTIFEVYATRSAGSGSQVADQIEMQQIMQILPTLGQRGRKAAIQDFVAAHRGHRYVNRYFPPEDQGDMPTQHDTIASIENNQLADGKQVIVSPDNDHLAHMLNHMRLLQETAQAYQTNPQAMFDQNTTLLQKTDEVFQAAGPHFVKHLFYAAQDPTMEAEVQQLNAQWAVMANFGDMIAVNANRQREAELRKVQEQQEALAQQEAQNTPEHIKARADVELKARKLEAQIQRDRLRDRHRFALEAEKLRQSGELQAAKAARELAIKAAKELSDAEQAGELPEQ